MSDDATSWMKTDSPREPPPSSDQPPALWPLLTSQHHLYAFSEGGYQFGWTDSGFNIVRSTMIKDRVLRTTPLTQAGWLEAWRILVTEYPQLANAVARKFRELDSERVQDSSKSQLTELGSLAIVSDCVLLGGYGYEESFAAGAKCQLHFTSEGLWVRKGTSWDAQIRSPYSEADALEISGPGHVRKGGGFIGGGFGLTGAAEGMIVASVLNALTTRTSIQTIVRWEARTMEAFFFTSMATPADLRIRLSAVLGCIKPRPTGAGGSDVVSEIERLAALHQQGALSDAEFDELKKQIIARR
jgi:hypothetical protein